MDDFAGSGGLGYEIDFVAMRGTWCHLPSKTSREMIVCSYFFTF